MAARILKGPGARHGSDNGNGQFDARLRDVETKVAKIEEKLNHVATRAWVLGGVLAGMGVAAGVAVGLAQLILKAASG
ncbi:MAG: hypothetical protein OXQ31_09685 [Spirochaetaceae bacterium]|nr:hypothetical protein [Spirochaetaceae bacterium]